MAEGFFEARQDADALAALPDRLRLPFAFDTAALQADLDALAGIEWTGHFVPAHYQGEWSVLPLRAPRGATHPILQIAPQPGMRDWVDTPLLAHCRYIQGILKEFACPIGAVRLMRLAADSAILEHRDDDLAPEFGSVRVHIPVRTNRGVDFRLNRKRVDMAEGECWFLRLAAVHSVANRGATDRVHLVIDLAINDWLARMLLDAAAASR